MKKSINAAIELVNTLRARLEDTKSLRDRCLQDTEDHYDGRITKKMANFDPTVLDERVVLLQNAIREANTKIKESNVKTEIELDIDEAKLLAPIPKRELLGGLKN